MSSTAYRDKAGRALTLTPAQRRERAQVAGQASNTVSALVRRIVRQKDQLTDEDRALLATTLDEAALFTAGVRTGARLAADHLAELVATMDGPRE